MSTKCKGEPIPLKKPNVIVRVRPLATEGGHSADDPPVFKRLASWVDGVGVVLEEPGGPSGQGDRQQKYTFARCILGPEATQEEVYGQSTKDLVHDFVSNGYNGLVFAYGQTGTGKTHSIFGHESSWGDVRHEQAGIFPRAALQIFAALESRAADTAFVLTASAMEFYMCECTDLLSDNAQCFIGVDHTPIGLVAVPLTCPEDCLAFMETCRAKRTSRATLMNAAEGGHQGSSRSHCSLILTLRTVEKDSGKCMKTALHIMDLAGAERPTKAGYDTSSAVQAVMDYWRGKPITVGGQGFIVNYELSALRTGVVQATEQHKKHKPLVIPKAMGTSFYEYAAGCFSGSNLLSMIVTLSPAPSCGWETWFSCTYGEDLNKLRCPVVPQVSKQLDRVVATSGASAAKSADALSATPHIGPASKYLKKRTIQARHDATEHRLYSQLHAVM